MEQGPPKERSEVRGKAAPPSGAGRPVFASTGPRGHRQRMRRRVLDNGTSGLADYEVLEMLLFAGVPRRDTKPLAKALINQFGSLSAVLGASADQLRAAGANAASARLFGVVATIARNSTQGAEPERTALGNWNSIVRYCTARHGDVEGSHLRVLFLNSQNHLLADDALAEPEAGASLEQSVPNIIRRALVHQACAVVTVRLGCGERGVDAMMAYDKAFATGVAEAAPLLALDAYGHLVIGQGGWRSFTHDGAGG